MNERKRQFPYKSLGSRLKKMRVARRETLAEVSGAIEVDIDLLSSFEEGQKRPSEDLLLLLISYFSIKEDEAISLWELAGYDQDGTALLNSADDRDTAAQSSVVVMPMDARVVYTDMVHVMVNNFGVVMNFMQTSGPNNRPLAISRIGMSKEHAKSVLEILQKTLAQSETKALPAPESSQRQQTKGKSGEQ